MVGNLHAKHEIYYYGNSTILSFLSLALKSIVLYTDSVDVISLESLAIESLTHSTYVTLLGGFDGASS